MPSLLDTLTERIKAKSLPIISYVISLIIVSYCIKSHNVYSSKCIYGETKDHFMYI